MEEDKNKVLIFKSRLKYRLFFCADCLAADGWQNRLEQMICFKPVDFDEIRRFRGF
nr:MAG TPA: hypothetical protein [Caudoviricetes sp.]